MTAHKQVSCECSKALQTNPEVEEGAQDLCIINREIANQKRLGSVPGYLLKMGDDCIIIDAKYKLAYQDSKVVEGIRQLSGYASSEKVLDYFGIRPADSG